MAKAKRRIAHFDGMQKVGPAEGWILLTMNWPRAGDWYIGWHELFRTRRQALDFAEANWAHSKLPYKAVRGSMSIFK